VVTQAAFSNSASGTLDLADTCGRKKGKKRKKEKNIAVPSWPLKDPGS
jgi:hypothetical protein